MVKVKSSFNTEKAIAAMKFVLSNMNNQTCDFHKLFKILYFAEKEHLAKYGRAIVGDKYIAMKDGPVPSTIYDILKVLRGDDSIFNLSTDFSKDFEITNEYFVHMLDNGFNIDIFSESQIECIEASIQENRNLSFLALRDKSHDYAWEAANADDRMSEFDIAKAGGANSELLKYMSIIAENKTIQLK